MRILATHLIYTAVLLVILASSLLTGTEAGLAGSTRASSPTPQGSYMLSQLASLTDGNWARVAGADTGLPPKVNGHDEFVAAWTVEMLRDLKDVPAGVFHQSFTPSGFVGAPPKTPAMNVLVVVPGARHPNQAIVIGAHPDGEPWSKGSAFDDASGCVIMLGLARQLDAYWREYGPPALTVEFALFDAEEQGLDGSIAYGFNLRHGALLPQPIFMIDEEQSGIGYPARPFGQLIADVMPSFAITTPSQPVNDMSPSLASNIRHAIGDFILPSASTLRTARERILAARATAFSDLRPTYGRISYRGGSAPAFGAVDERYVTVTSRSPGGSDNEPFEALGLPTVTLAGDSAFYARNAPDWAYPFDQPEDTLTAMACDTGGSPTPGTALAAALDLEVAMSFALVKDYDPARGPGFGTGTRPLILSTVAGVGLRVVFQVLNAARSATSPTWSFGDGGRASGQNVVHTFLRAGHYAVVVRAGRNVTVKHITVAKGQPAYASQLHGLEPPRKPWAPPELQGIAGC